MPRSRNALSSTPSRRSATCRGLSGKRSRSTSTDTRRDPLAKILIGKYEGTIYKEGDHYTGAISLGFGPDGRRKRLKRKGRNKTEVKDRLIEAVKDLESGVASAEN